MKRIVLIFVLSLVCGGAVAQLRVEVSNPGKAARSFETVEIPWTRVEAAVQGITHADAVVTDASGKQVPSQAVYAGEDQPQSLIFQVSLPGKGKTVYTVDKGGRELYPEQAYGRYVPERMDDYAWENNVVAYRIYGPALERELVTPGIDFWAKKTPELIINKWYKLDLSGVHSYHADGGEGNDCYKVGPTLGCGASAPYADGELCLSRNYKQWERLDNGPVRTTVRLTYAPFKAGGKDVALVKIISLDANSHFNRITDYYTGVPEAMTVAAGVVSYAGNAAEAEQGRDYIALYEPASDSQSGRDGQIGTAVIVPGMKGSAEVGKNKVALVRVEPGEPFVYYAGAGTSKADAVDAKAWFKIAEQKAGELARPLKVRLK